MNTMTKTFRSLLFVLIGCLLASCSANQAAPTATPGTGVTASPAVETTSTVEPTLEYGTMTSTPKAKAQTPTPIDPREEDMKKEVQALAGQKLISSSRS
jgi:hypothetical protein